MTSVFNVINLITQVFGAGQFQLLPLVFLTGALIWFVLCASVLTIVDIREHRLPNRWTGLLFAGGAILLVATTLSATHLSELSGRWVSTLAGAGIYLGVMGLLHIITRGGLGMGDVKLAAGLGLYTGFLGYEMVIAGFVLAFLVGGLQAAYVVIIRRGSVSARIAFGPAMLLGCLITLIM